MNKKFKMAVLGLAISCTFFAGCSNKDNDKKQEASSTDSSEVVEIEYWHTMSAEKGKAMDMVVDDFNNTIGKERGIKVKSVYQGDDVNEKLKTLSQSKDTANFPDVAQIAGPATPSVMNYEQTVTPEEMYKKGKDIIVPKEDLVENASRTFTYKDELKAMPFNVSSILLYYNVNAFKEAGLDPDKAPETIADLAEYSKKLAKKDGDNTVYGLNVQVKRYQLANWLGGQGEYNFIGNNEGGRSGMMTEVTAKEELRKYLTEWKKVVESGGYQAVENNINEEFALGLHSMVIMSSARIEIVSNLVGDKFEWKTARLPKVDKNDKGGTATGGSGTAFFNKGDDKKLTASWLFAQYLASPKAQIVFDTNTGYLPVNKKAVEDEEFKKYLDENPNYKVAVDQMFESNPNVQEPFDIINWEINDIVDSQMLEFAENPDVDKTTDNIINQCNEKLKEYENANK